MASEFIARNGIISNDNSIILGALTANTFIKSGGTSLQYLMADGSVTTLSSTSGITGSGISNQVAYFNSTTSITSSANLFFDNTNSFFGVGTSVVNIGDFGSSLTVRGNSGVVPTLTSYRATNSLGNGTGFQSVLNNSLGNPVTYTYFNGAIENNTAGSERGYLGWFVKSNGILTEWMRLNGSGRVAIGTPTFDNGIDRLQVSGTVFSTGGFKKSGGTSNQFLKADGSVDSLLVSGNTITGTSYTLTNSDHIKQLQTTNSGTTIIIIPTGLTSGFACDIIQEGTGQITVSGSTGVTVRYSSFELPTTFEQYSMIGIESITNLTDNYKLLGQLTSI